MDNKYSPEFTKKHAISRKNFHFFWGGPSPFPTPQPSPQPSLLDLPQHPPELQLDATNWRPGEGTLQPLCQLHGSSTAKKTTNQNKEDITDWFDLSVVDVTDKSDEPQCKHTVRRRPLDGITLYHRYVVSSAQVRLQYTQRLSHLPFLQ